MCRPQNASDSIPMLLHAQRHHANRHHHAHALHTVQHLLIHATYTTLFLGGEVNLVLRCVSRGFASTTIAFSFSTLVTV